jgi:hypothetical protein
MSHRKALGILGAVVALAAAVAIAIPPIRQSSAYHLFADTRRILGIENALNVLSNAPFVVVGVWGLLGGAGSRPSWPVRVLFAATALVAVGSAYYHLAPSDARLVWDRLPMAVVFMAILAIVVAQWISPPLGNKVFAPLQLAGIGSVILWQLTGDLRAYVLVQFLPLLLVPLILVLFAGPRGGRRGLALGTGLYVLAKALELLDRPLYSVGQLVSGHTLKHLAAAAAIYVVARALASAGPSPADNA